MLEAWAWADSINWISEVWDIVSSVIPPFSLSLRTASNCCERRGERRRESQQNNRCDFGMMELRLDQSEKKLNLCMIFLDLIQITTVSELKRGSF